MLKQSCFAFCPLMSLVLLVTPATADELKHLTIEKGKAVIIANLVAARPDCSNNPGPQPLPILSEKPLHGAVGVQLGVTDVAAAGNCPGRKIPSLGMFYLPAADYIGTDSFQIEIDAGNNKQTKVSYQVTILDSENKPK
jgi:hypothetical protein